MADSTTQPGGDRQRRFHMRDCLGRGGFGEVYLATMVSPGGLKSDVAVKLLRDASADALRRLRDEGKLLAALNHPAILRAHDLAGLDGNVALVTEFVDGADLTELTNGPVPMPPRALLEIAAVVAEALHVAFSTVPPDAVAPLRLVHRDVKPSNIRIGKHGEVKLLDFGIAWAAVAGREAQTNATAMMGSLPYMAPERFARSPAHPASDVYALGCSIYEGLAGARLFPDASPVDMARLAAAQDEHDGHVEQKLAGLPPDALLAIPLLRELLAYDPGTRPEAVVVAARCDALADEAAGARLKSWARTFDWGAPREGGPLSGKTLTEQTLSAMTGWSGGLVSENSVDRTIDLGASASWGSATFDVGAQITEEERPAASRTWVPWLGLGVVAVLFGAFWTQWSGADVAAPMPAPVPVAPAPAPEPAPEPAAPVPEPEPVEVAPPPEVVAPVAAPVAPVVVSPTPTPPRPEPVVEPEEPEVVEPEPVIEPPEPVAPKSVAMGTILYSGELRVELRAEDGTQHAPGELPAGRYDILADFGDGLAPAATIDVAGGGMGRIRCNKLYFTCEVQ